MILEIDSTEVFSILQDPQDGYFPLKHLVDNYEALIVEGGVIFLHTLREENQCADSLANMGAE